jgi:hypothetical protein
MPRSRKEQHLYIVLFARYRSETVKQAYERGEVPKLEEGSLIIETWPCGYDKRRAAVKFYNVCLDAMKDPLASRVVLICGEERVYVWMDQQNRAF